MSTYKNMETPREKFNILANYFLCGNSFAYAARGCCMAGFKWKCLVKAMSRFSDSVRSRLKRVNSVSLVSTKNR